MQTSVVPAAAAVFLSNLGQQSQTGRAFLRRSHHNILLGKSTSGHGWTLVSRLRSLPFADSRAVTGSLCIEATPDGHGGLRPETFTVADSQAGQAGFSAERTTITPSSFQPPLPCRRGMLSTLLNRRKVLCFGTFHIIQAVSSFSARKPTPLQSRSPAFIASNRKMSAASEEDPYLWLEEVRYHAQRHNATTPYLI